jgi:hypothetical protein
MGSVEGHVSHAYTGVNWRMPIYDRLFTEVEFSGALNDSEKGNRAGWAARLPSANPAVGVPDNPNIDIVGSIDHVSHPGLCGRTNPGLSSFGYRLGYAF